MALVVTQDPPKPTGRRARSKVETDKAGTTTSSAKEVGRRRGVAKHAGVFVIEEVKIARANPEERIELLRAGFRARVITEMAERMGWSREHAIERLHLKRSTVMRRIKADERLDTSESERLLYVMDLIEQVQEMIERSGDATDFDASRWVAGWLESPNPALGGKRPAEYLDTNEGAQIVRRLLAQMESGAYA